MKEDILADKLNSLEGQEIIADIELQQEEVEDLEKILEAEYKKYKKYCILRECIEECIEECSSSANCLAKSSAEKVKAVMLNEELSQIKGAVDIDDLESLLGINLNLSTELFSLAESENLITSLNSKLDEKIPKFKQRHLFGKIGNNYSEEENALLELSREDQLSFNYHTSLVSEQECCVNNMLDFENFLEQLKDVRLETVPELVDKKINEHDLKSKINYLKFEICKEKCRIDTIAENDQTLEAYEIALKDLKEQQEELCSEIEDLKNLKKQYDEICCKEYKDILQSYLQYKTYLDKREMMENICKPSF